MADTYIDFYEVGEYGPHFMTTAEALRNASEMVAVDKLIALVKTRVDNVAAELERAGIKRSDLRAGNGGLGETAASARELVARFWNHLLSLDPKEFKHDVAAFFAGERLGALAALKPSDVKAKVGTVLKGFAAPGNASLPLGAQWKAKLEAAHESIGGSEQGQGNALMNKLNSSRELGKARQDFIDAYNGVAKPIIRGLLALLGREDELKNFFKDLQVQEDQPRGASSTTGASEAKAGAGAPATATSVAGADAKSATTATTEGTSTK